MLGLSGLFLLFLRFEAPETTEFPVISNAGKAFRPEIDQLPGSCMDFYAIDGWIHYSDQWLLNCRDNALVTFGDTGVVARRESIRGPINRMFVRLFDNLWDTNFTANACGMMQFHFTAAAGVDSSQVETRAEVMDTEPVVAVKMGY